MYQKTILENGLRVISSRLPHCRSVSVCVFLAVGSRYEAEPEAGLSHFVEHMSFKGTRRRPTPREVAASIEGVGGVINAATDRELTTYWCKVARHHFPLALDVLADILLASRYDAAEMERERQVIIEELHMVKDMPHLRVGMLADELLWPGHPLGRDVAGTEESVSAITREELLRFVERRYLPCRAVVAVAGDIKHEQVVEGVARAFAAWRDGTPPPGFQPFVDAANPRLEIAAEETEQTHLCLALPGLPSLHPQRYALDVMNVLLGEGMSSRLFVKIRDELGLAYSISSYVEHLRDTGALTIYAGVEHSRLAVAVKAIVEELALMRKPVGEEELRQAKEQTKGRLLLRMEDSRGVAAWIGAQEVLNGCVLTVDEVVAAVDALGVEDIQAVADDILRGEQLRLAVVGPVREGGSLEALLTF